MGMKKVLAAAFTLLLGVCLSTAASAATQTTTLTISGQNNVVVSGLMISTTSGDCIDIFNSTNVTIQASQIGSCAGRGINIVNSSVNVYDNYIHVDNLSATCDNSHDGVEIQSTLPVNVKGNVIAYSENHIIGWNTSNLVVDGNFLLNVRGSANCSDADNLQGHGVQVWGSSIQNNVIYSNNYLLDKKTAVTYQPAQSDGLSCGYVTNCTIRNNWVQFDQSGTNTTNQNACGVILDSQASYSSIVNNVISNTYNCGVGLTSGPFNTASGNKVEMLAPNTGSAQAVEVTDYSYSGNCHDMTVGPGNIGYAIQEPAGYVTGFWGDHNACSWTDTGNTWGQAAYNLLNPIASTNPPPRIPPVPVSCVATSPYSTQTNYAPCSGSVMPPPPPPPAAPTASLTANPTSIPRAGKAATLSWSSTNTTSCIGAGFAASGISGSTSVRPATTTTYSVTCTGQGGSATASATVRVRR